MKIIIKEKISIVTMPKKKKNKYRSTNKNFPKIYLSKEISIKKWKLLQKNSVHQGTNNKIQVYTP